MPEHPSHRTGGDGPEAAVYWFARLAGALSQGDYILATEAQKRLNDLGFIVNPSRPRGDSLLG